MELSRSKKNAELHQELSTSPEAQIETQDLSRFADRLNAIDENSFNKMNSEATSDHPQHVQNYSAPVEEVKKEVKVEPVVKTQVKEALPSFNNEYLDEFLDEVKQYNIQKGLRNVEDTQLNIMAQLRGELPPAREPEYLQTIKMKPLDVKPEYEPEEKETEETIVKPDMASEIRKLMEEDVIEQPSEPEVQPTSEITQEILEQTTQLKEKIEDYDEKLDSMDAHMIKVNRVLNTLLAVLFIILLGSLAVLVYFFLKTKGMI